MIRVYVAGPIGPEIGREQRNIAAIAAANEVATLGFSPFVPHLFARWDESYPHDYEWWMSHCFVWLAQCQALLRIPGESPGADREVVWCEANGVPVFRTIADLNAARCRLARAT